MKVKDLILLLQREDPNLEVYAMTDHGQAPEKVSCPTVIFTEDTLKHNLWDGFAFEAEDAEEFGYSRRVILL